MKQPNRKRIIFAASGTGGHLHPAQAIAQSEKIQKAAEILFAGHDLSSNPYFDKKKFFYTDISAPFVRAKNLFADLFHHYCGFIKAFKMLKSNSDLVIGFGSIYTFPILLAAFFKRCPYVLFNSDARLGKLQKLFYKKATKNLYALFPIKQKAKRNFQKVKMPLLSEKTEKIESSMARLFFKLDPNQITVLIFGGSQGAVTMNEVVMKALFLLREKGTLFQVIHLIGSHMDVKEVEDLYIKKGINCCVKEFEKEMGKAYSAADILIARCGSSTVAETLHHELPALYIPYPFLKDQHQKHNAEFVKQIVQGGDWISQVGLCSENLCKKIELMLQNKEFYKRNIDHFNHYDQETTAEEAILECMLKTLEKKTVFTS